MIKNLFRRKPIYQITLPTPPLQGEYEDMKKNIKSDLGDDYKIVIIIDTHKDYIETKLLK